MIVKKLKVLEAAARTLLFFFRNILALISITALPWLAGTIALALAAYLWVHKLHISFPPDWLFWIVDLPFVAMVSLLTMRFMLKGGPAAPLNFEFSKALLLVILIHLVIGAVQIPIDKIPQAVTNELVQDTTTRPDTPGNLRIIMFANLLTGLLTSFIFAVGYPMLPIAYDRRKLDWDAYAEIMRLHFFRLFLVSMLLVAAYKGFEMAYFWVLATFTPSGSPWSVNSNLVHAIAEYLLFYAKLYPVSLIGYVLPPIAVTIIYKAVRPHLAKDAEHPTQA